ncbi:MAG: intradiol ring-cleavage dioxygenase [Acidobacteriaceae bacterium]|nr:intradiol ring-cleavage dioxygenase [Acidobacteriaceae bacterium]
MSLSRRRFVSSALTLATTLQLQRAARALGFAPGASVCTLAAEQEVGPYYVADELLRADIREGKAGVPLSLRLIVLDSRTCKPLPQAAIDVWHCDALGVYSGYTKSNLGGPGGPDGGMPPPPGADGQGNPPQGPPPDWDGSGASNGAPRQPPPPPPPTDKLTFLRGIQETDDAGRVDFSTVYPGFYMGRTNHIHFKVRLGGAEATREGGKTYQAGHTSHVGQVFFTESLNAELMELAPYREHKIHRTTNTEDMVVRSQHGDGSIASVVWVKKGDPTAGLRAELVVAVDPTATPAPAERFGPGGPPSHTDGSGSGQTR